MELSLHTLTRGANLRKKRRIGRGNASGHGTHSGRGLNGQSSRSGGKGGRKLKAFKQQLQSIPKMGGFKSPYDKPQTVSLKDINTRFCENDIVTLQSLLSHKLINKEGGRMPIVKILSNGRISKKFIIKDCLLSESAKEKVIAAGGVIHGLAS